MKTRKTTSCVICGEPVKQDKSTSVDRQTCNRKVIDGVLQKSECEKEKNRRYQDHYRKNNSMTGNPITVKNRSVALSSANHLAKHKAKKYKRNCLKCEDAFIGTGRYNRICELCTTENSRQSNLKGA